MRDADTAMYHAKSRGKARHEVFDADMHARVRDRLEPRERPAPRDRQPTTSRCTTSRSCRWHSGMCVGFESLVRWKRNGEPVSPVDLHPDRRGARADRAARHLGAPAGVPHVRRLAAALSRCRPRLHHGQRVEPAARAAELPARRRAGRAQTGLRPADLRVEITETALMDNPGEAADVLARAARLRREGLSRRLRHRLFVAEPPAQAAGRRAQDRSVVRQQPAAPRPSGDRREHPGARADAQHQRRRGRYRERRAGARARAPRLHARAGLSVLASAVDARRPSRSSWPTVRSARKASPPTPSPLSPPATPPAPEPEPKSGLPAGEPERGHLFAVAHQQDVADQHRVIPGLALDRRERAPAR